MSSNHAGSNLFGGVLVLLLVGGLAYVVTQTNRNTLPAQGGSDSSIVPEGLPATTDADTTPTPTQATTPTVSSQMPSLLYLKSVATGAQLIKRDNAAKETVLFTDSDSKLKLSTVLGIVDDKAVSILSDDDEQSQLAEILLDGTGKTNILNANFGGIAGAALRETTKKVAFTVFDNSERNFGFTLTQEQFDGSGRTTIDQDTQGISLPIWSQSGTTLAYVKGQSTPDAGQEIRNASDGSNPKTVYKLAKNTVVTDLVWLNDQALIYVVEPLGDATQNKAKTMILHIDSGEQKDLFDLPGKERSLAVSKDGGWLAAITGDVDQSGAGSGKLMLIELSSGKQTVLGSADSVGSWINQ